MTPGPGVFTVSNDQSHWRQEIVNSDSTGLVIALPPESFASTEFIRSGVNVKGYAPVALATSC